MSTPRRPDETAKSDHHDQSDLQVLQRDHRCPRKIYLIKESIARHPGSTNELMVNDVVGMAKWIPSTFGKHS
jgi:hypothetical protein